MDRARTTLLIAMLCLGAVSCAVTLFAFGEQTIGWADPSGHVQLAIFMAFLFGIISGMRVRQ